MHVDLGFGLESRLLDYSRLPSNLRCQSSLFVVLLSLFESVVLLVVCLCLEVVFQGLEAHGRALGLRAGKQ